MNSLPQAELTPKSWTPILTFGVFTMGKYSTQFKTTAIKTYIDGSEGFRKVAQRYFVDTSLLRRWVAVYLARGAAGLRPQGHHYSVAFKLSVIQCMQKEHLSQREVAARFGLGQSSQVGIWARRYYSGGLDALSAPKKRKAAAMPDKTRLPNESQPADDDLKSREQLKAELEYLRMENAYLKKLEEIREAPNRNHLPGKKR